MDDERYHKLLVSRPVMPMGGTWVICRRRERKAASYMQPIYDNLDFIVAANMDMRRRSTHGRPARRTAISASSRSPTSGAAPFPSST